MDKALLLIHRASSSVERLATILREKGFAPVVVSSRPGHGSESFVQKCAALDLPCLVSEHANLSMADLQQAMACHPGRYRFAFSVWDGHRFLMAQANQQLGAPDLAPQDVASIQDKYVARELLRAAGLSHLRAYRLDDPALPSALASGERHIARPRRGAGALLTAVITSHEQARALQARLTTRAEAGDMFSEFFGDNEIFVEPFFEGREFSVEMIRSRGETVFRCWHEKTDMRVSSSTILECAFASPCVSVTPDDIEQGNRFCESAMRVLAMDEGCFHVEVLRNAAGQWELIEVNARPGGGLVAESVFQRYGGRMGADWVDLLAGRPLGERRPASCGTYFQFGYPAEGRRIAQVSERSDVPAPHIYAKLLDVGSIARTDREDFATMCLWRTALSTHADEVQALSRSEYVQFSYSDITETV